MEYVGLGKFMGDGPAVAIGAKAPHPNAGKAFIVFFIGEEGPRLMAGVGEFVTRKGIYPPLPDADKIVLVDMIAMDKRRTPRKWLSTRNFFAPVTREIPKPAFPSVSSASDLPIQCLPCSFLTRLKLLNLERNEL